MNRKASESAVDRLIALALEEKPGRPGAAAAKTEPQMEIAAVPVMADAALPSVKELEQNPMWKALLQLRTILPYVSRVLEMSGPAHTSTGLSTEVRQSVTALESGHRELRIAMQDQALELKRVQEAVTRTQEATERNTNELTEVAEDLRSMHTLVRRATTIVSVLLLALIGLVVYAVVRMPHLLH